MRFCFLPCLRFFLFVFPFRLRANVGNSRHPATRSFPQSSLAKWSFAAPHKYITQAQFLSSVNISNDGQFRRSSIIDATWKRCLFCSLYVFSRILVPAFIPLPIHFHSLLWPSGTLEHLSSTLSELDSSEFQEFRTTDKLKSPSIIDATWK